MGNVSNFSKKGAFEKSETTHPMAQRRVQDGSNFQKQSYKDTKSDKVILFMPLDFFKMVVSISYIILYYIIYIIIF